MKNHTGNHAARAPRLHNRRHARIYAFPWGQLLLASLLSILSVLIDTHWQVVMIWWGFTAVCCTLQDLATRQSLLMTFTYWLMNKLKLKSPGRPYLKDATKVYSLFNAPLYERREHIHWRMSLFILLFSWVFALIQSGATLQSQTAQALLVVFLWIYGIVPYGMLIIDPMEYAKRPQRYFIWGALGLIGIIMGPLSFWWVTGNALFAFVGAFFIALLYTAVFLSQRLWAGERIINEVIQEISLHFISWPDVNGSLEQVPEIIGKRLRHDHVYILEPVFGQEKLIVSGNYGDNIVNREFIPLANSITGKAYNEKESVVWNDVRACPYFHHLGQEKTLAEICVPITHQGVTFGVLDVQSHRKGVYEPDDVAALETIARILGAVIAVQKRKEFFHVAVQLWEDMLAAAAFVSEHQAFTLFADFAQKMLDADLVIYFPLSLSGYPIDAPYKSGTFKRPDLQEQVRNDSDSSLIQLIKRWQPYYEPNVTAGSLVARSTSTNSPSFISREEIKSTCFIPVGMQQERLGALFLNFRREKVFDEMFKFAVLSLGQSLAKITAQIRYRSILLKSFGRPELNLHSIIGRHGLKEGVLHNAANVLQNKQNQCCAAVNDCALHPLMQQLEVFLQEIYLTESSIPPDFWQTNLYDQLNTHIKDLPHRSNGRRPIVKLNINPALERESPWIKLALYRVITEAINNSVCHGDTTLIHVFIERLAGTVEVQVSNNGNPLRPDAEKYKSNNGIYTLLTQFRQQLGATTEIKAGENNNGTIVNISLPALPID